MEKTGYEVSVLKEADPEMHPMHTHKEPCILGKFYTEVSFYKLDEEEGFIQEWMVSVHSFDDFGLSKLFTNENEAWNCFLSVIALDILTIENLVGMGLHGD